MSAGERLAVDTHGDIFPCFYVTDSREIAIPATIPIPYSRDLPIPMEFVREEMKALEPCTASVVRGFGFHMEGESPSTGFTAFFVAPNILVSARHNLYDNTTRFSKYAFSLHSEFCNTALFPKDYFKSMEVLFEPSKEDFNPSKEDPPAGRTGAFLQHDFAFFTTADYRHQTWLAPSAAPPNVEDLFITIQFNGTVTNSWVDMQRRFAPQLPVNLSASSTNDALFDWCQSASAGIITRVSPPVAFYALSSSPGASGAPGFAAHSGGQFSAIHGGGTTEEPNNHGTLATDPDFVDAYSTYVVPALN